MFMTLLSVILITESHPEHHGKMFLKIGYVRYVV